MLALAATGCTQTPPEVEDPTAGPDGTSTTTPGDSGGTTPTPPGTDAGSEDSEGTTSGPADTTSGPADSTGDTTGSDDDSSDSSGDPACTSFTLGSSLIRTNEDPWFWDSSSFDPLIGEPMNLDIFRLELWDEGPHTGVFDLSMGPNNDYSTCLQCIRIFEDGPDALAATRQYFPESGTLQIDENAAPAGPMIAAFDNVRLVEVTIDPKTLETTAVPDGQCLLLDGYMTAPNNSCENHCGAPGPVPGSFPTCYCNDDCDDFGDCCPDICADDVCGGDPVCTNDTDTEIGENLALPFIDNDYDGTLGTMTCHSLAIEEEGINTITEVEVEIGMNHTHVGDLVGKVQSPAGTVVTLFSRPGRDEPADDGSGGMGDSSDLTAAAPIRFFDAAPTDAEDLGTDLGNGGDICLDDGICDFFPNPGAATPGNLATFDGENSAGSWQICVGDAAGGDVGEIDYVRLTVDQVN